jgi:polar amino acid transport system substrate-binding protein
MMFIFKQCTVFFTAILVSFAAWSSTSTELDDSRLVAESTDLNKVVTIAGDNWCPINCGEKDSLQGYMIDVARLALKEFGYEVRYQEAPWPRAVLLARNGDINAIAGAYKGDAPDFIFPQTPLLHMSSSSLFTRLESSWRYQNVESLSTLRLGVVNGYDYADSLTEYIQKNVENTSRITRLSGDDVGVRNIKMLLKYRIDVLAESAPVVWYAAKKMGVTAALKEVGKVSPAEPCYITFSPNHPDSLAIAAAFDRGVEILHANGKLKKLSEVYGLPDSVMPAAHLGN